MYLPNFRRVRTVIFMILFVCSTVPSFSQGEVIAGTEPVDQMLQGFMDRLDQLINNVDDVINRRSFDIRQHAFIVLDHLDFILTKQQGKLFEELTDQQQELLKNINFTINELEASQGNVLEELEGITDKAIAFAGTLPGSKRIPVVTDASPSYFQVSGDEEADIEINGSWLSRGNPTLVLDDTQYQSFEKIDSRLRFKVPFSEYSDSTKVVHKTLNLRVYRKSFFFFKKKLPYNIAMSILPETFAGYRVDVVVRNQKRDEVARGESFSHMNNHCQGAVAMWWTVNPTPGWRINTSTIVHRATHVSTNSYYAGVRSVTETGFQIGGNVVNNGRCLGPIARDGRGSLEVEATYNEFRISDVDTPQNSFDTGVFQWKKDKSIQRPSKERL